jgi:hypothetical protein
LRLAATLRRWGRRIVAEPFFFGFRVEEAAPGRRRREGLRVLDPDAFLLDRIHAPGMSANIQKVQARKKKRSAVS